MMMHDAHTITIPVPSLDPFGGPAAEHILSVPVPAAPDDPSGGG